MTCNCVVVWDPVREEHVWVNGSLRGDCGHPPSGTPHDGKPVYSGTYIPPTEGTP